MAGTVEGGFRTRDTNRAKYGKDYYANIGYLGGIVSHPETRPFTVDRQLAKRAGRNGGLKSKRGPAKAEKISQPKKSQPKKISQTKKKAKIRDIVKGFYEIFQ